MHYIPTLLAALLAGPALAFPGNFQPTTAPISIGNIPRPPVSTGDTNPGPGPGPGLGPESPSDGGGVGSTITDTITKTRFVPCSTPMASSGTSTWYSTWLTATTWTTTTCHTEPTIPQPTTSTYPEPNEICPPRATVTVTVTTTQDGPTPSEALSSATHCPSCQTFTLAGVEGGSRITTVLPPTTTAQTLVKTTSSTHPAPTGPTSNSPVPSGSKVRRTLAVPYPVYF